MIFSLFLIILWFLTLVSPVGDYRRYIQSLSDPRATVPDNPVGAKESKPAGFGRGKRILAIYKWVDALFNYFTDLVGRPRPTRTIHFPTKVFVPVYPAPPIPARQVRHYRPTYPASTAFDLAGLWTTHKLAVGWVAVTFSILVLTFVQFLSHSHSKVNGVVETTDYSDQIPPANDPEVIPSFPSLHTSLLESFDSIVDLYCSLEFPPAAALEDVPLLATTENELFELANSPGSAHADAARTRFTWIDTKTGVEGNTETYGASAGGKTLEPAASNSSIGIIGLYTRESSVAITSSSSRMSISRSSRSLAPADRFSPSGQMFTPRRKLFLERLIIRLRNMERVGNSYGRVYDDWTDNPELETRIEAPRIEPTGAGVSNSVHSDGHLDTPIEGATELGSSFLIPTETSNSQYCNTSAQNLSTDSGSVLYLSSIASQDSLDAQLGSLLELQGQEAVYHPSDNTFEPVPVPGLNFSRVRRRLIEPDLAHTGANPVGEPTGETESDTDIPKVQLHNSSISIRDPELEIESDSSLCDLYPASTTLPLSPAVGWRDLISQLDSEMDIHSRAIYIDPTDMPVSLSPSVEDDRGAELGPPPIFIEQFDLPTNHISGPRSHTNHLKTTLPPWQGLNITKRPINPTCPLPLASSSPVESTVEVGLEEAHCCPTIQAVPMCQSTFGIELYGNLDRS
ncbi:hypothetical protein OPQ81_009075 [Rhizoctonia solani]|nr:hypothetical protein OPQ81_009075 [Rhizoctonia solani]